MTMGQPTGIMNIPYKIMEMERAIKTIPWWNLVKKYKYQSELSEMRCIGARIGFEQALNDLAEAGIIKFSK